MLHGPTSSTDWALGGATIRTDGLSNSDSVFSVGAGMARQAGAEAVAAAGAAAAENEKHK